MFLQLLKKHLRYAFSRLKTDLFEPPGAVHLSTLGIDILLIVNTPSVDGMWSYVTEIRYSWFY